MGDAAVHFSAHHPLGILDGDASCSLRHEHHAGDDGDHRRHHQQADDQVARHAELVHDRVRKPGDNPDEDDERDAVPDPPFRDLLAEPHHEHRAGGQEKHGAQRKPDPLDLQGNDRLLIERETREADADAPPLEGRNDHGPVPGELIQFLAPLLPLLRELLEIRDNRTEELQDDGGADVRHDAEGKDRRVAERASDEQIVQSEEGIGRLIRFRLRQQACIDARQRHMGADADDDQEQRREQKPRAEFLDLEYVA